MKLKREVGILLNRIKSGSTFERVESISILLLLVSALLFSFSLVFSYAVPAMVFSFISLVSIIILAFCWIKEGV